MIEIEIDNKPLKVVEGATIIEAADAAGIYIPRFCYHPKLSIAANCRMCLVEVEKSRKPLPACATPVTAGMKVYTRSPLVIAAQRAVMEFLLINHPLDCPICDQGGECELQDLSMGFGAANSEYQQPKRSVASDDLGPLIETWMTRCIHCTRCVRFGEEIAGLREMGVTFRGEEAQVGTYIKHFLQSELSGNIIDICPVGALTNKPARYSGRAWEYHEHASIAAHDAVGSHLFVHTRGDILEPQRQVMRAVPRVCEFINETWISDRDRYSVHGLYHEERLYQPQVKIRGQWQAVTWQRALDEVADRTRAIITAQGGEQLAALTSPNATVEELFLLQKLLRALGSDHIDYRQREHDFSDQGSKQAFPGLNSALVAVDKLQAVLLVGSNLRCEQPLLAHRVHKAANRGASVMALNAVDYRFAFAVQEKMIASPRHWVRHLAKIAKALADQVGQVIPELAQITPCETARAIAANLQKKSAIFIGEQAMQHHQAASLRALAYLIARLSGATVALLPAGANATGAWLAGAIPQAGGRHAKDLLTDNPVSGYFLWNIEPELDSAYPVQAMQTLQQAGMVVCFTPFVSAAMRRYAHVLLPIAPFTEMAGTLVNMEGSWQSFKAVSVAHQEARSGWKVLRVLANFLELPGFDYQSEKQVLAAVKKTFAQRQSQTQSDQTTQLLPNEAEGGLSRLMPWPMYRVDNLVRRSTPLQETISLDEKAITLSPDTAAKYGYQAGDQVTAVQGDTQVTLPLLIDPRLADDTVVIAGGLQETQCFGNGESVLVLERGAL